MNDKEIMNSDIESRVEIKENLEARLENRLEKMEGMEVNPREGLGRGQRMVRMHFFALFAVFFWGLAFPFTKIAGDTVGPVAVGAGRTIIAAVILGVLAVIRHARLPRSMWDAFLFCVSGASGFGIYMVLFNKGLMTISSATSSLVIAIAPVLTALIASKLYKERLTPIGYLAIALAFLGVVVLLLWDGVLSIDVGVIWTFGAALLFCVYNLLNAYLERIGYTAFEIVTYSIISGAVMLFVIEPEAMTEITDAGRSTVLAVILLGIVCTVGGYLFWNIAFSYADLTTDVTNHLFLTPLFSAVIGFIVLHEIPNLGTLIGGVIIILSVLLFNKSGKADTF